MSFTQCPDDVAPGDIVRCKSLAGVRPGSPLAIGNIYTVRAIEGLDDVEALQRSRAPVVHLAGIPGAYATFRFELVARAVAAPSGASEIAVRMAAVMREREAATGACDQHDLARAGFTSAQIIEYADEARGLAGAPSRLAAA